MCHGATSRPPIAGAAYEMMAEAVRNGCWSVDSMCVGFGMTGYDFFPDDFLRIF